MHLVAWEKICLPKGVGALNLINLMIWNNTNINVTYYGLLTKTEKGYNSLIHVYYIKHPSIE